MFCTITSIAESPLEKGVIWCGTDDGQLQITRDGGQTWKNVISAVPGLPRNTWCSRVEASHFDAATAYAAFDGHRTDDYAAYVYRTADFGKTWKSIKTNLPFGWVHVIREDVRNKNLLFVGTEFGIHASLDGGGSWFSLKNDLPTAAVHDIAVHPRANDLIIGTHGRGIWIMDDISFLQEMSPEVLDSDIHLFSIRPAVAHLISTRRESFTKALYSGKNPLYGMAVTAYFRVKPKERPKVSILDRGNEPVFEFNFNIKEGILRDFWNLQTVPKSKEGKKFTPPAMGLVALPLVAPGDFTVELAADGRKLQTQAAVRPDPRYEMAEDERRAQYEALAEILALSKKMGLSVTAAANIRRQLDSSVSGFQKEGKMSEVVGAAFKAFEEKFKPVEGDIVPRDFGSSQLTREVVLRGGPVNLQLLTLGMSIGGFPSAPTKTDLLRLEQIGQKVEDLVARMNQVIKEHLPELNGVLEEAKLKPLNVPAEIKL
jgi:hypothetical protein